jgi:hypothetical protein
MLGNVDLVIEPIRIALELERGVQPLAGRVTSSDGFDRQFVGWTGLAAALTLALEQAENGRPEQPIT